MIVGAVGRLDQSEPWVFGGAGDIEVRVAAGVGIIYLRRSLLRFSLVRPSRV